MNLFKTNIIALAASMKRFYFLLPMIACAISCNDTVTLVSTDADKCFVTTEIQSVSVPSEECEIVLNTSEEFLRQSIDGFGACFSEMAWDALNLLSEQDRESILSDWFEPGKGASFNVCRLPVGASDYGRNWYSYDEVDGDFAMEHFSVENDETSLIPFVHRALSYNPDIVFWSSPWCPPSWMKYNKHYAMRCYDPNSVHTSYDNGLTPELAGKEGRDMFIQEPEYLEALALYFEKYVKAYAEHGIRICAIQPQNEFNSDQVFPSCCWTARGLNNFIGNYLGPRMEALGVDVIMSTERPNYKLMDTIYSDAKSSKYLKAAGFQWAGRGAIKDFREHYPDMKLYMSEHECGDGANSWGGLLHSWDLVRDYFNQGVSMYEYWNFCTLDGGHSRWNWPENALVTVNPTERTFKYTWDYMLIKHMSAYVKKGARYISQNSEMPQAIAFLNPDGQVIVLYVETKGEEKVLNINVNGKSYAIDVKPSSINTCIIGNK